MFHLRPFFSRFNIKVFSSYRIILQLRGEDWQFKTVNINKVEQLVIIWPNVVVYLQSRLSKLLSNNKVEFSFKSNYIYLCLVGDASRKLTKLSVFIVNAQK